VSALLEVRHLTTTFPREHGRVRVVDDVSFSIAGGEVVALVGESGCGKSLTALSILRLVPKPGRLEADTRISLEGTELTTLSVPEMRKIRGHQIAMIFQEPMSALNPVVTVGAQVVEAIRLHERIASGAARKRVEELFERVGIPDPRKRFDSYPHQLSGGLKQRVMIAMAVSMRPRLLIADEPTTALDVTVQAQILELLRELQTSLGTSILLITHDLGVVNELADRVLMMYAGRTIESGERHTVLSQPRHPYTRGLLRAIPARAARGARLFEIQGVVPSPEHWPSGCRFAPRCELRFEPCEVELPEETRLSADHTVCCHAVAREQASSGAVTRAPEATSSQKVSS